MENRKVENSVSEHNELSILFENVCLSFGKHELFKNVTLKIFAGRVIGVAGQNGAGKSTFLKLASQILKPDEGAVKIFVGEKILSRAEVRKKIAVVTPEMKIYDELTAEENLKFFTKLRGKNLTEEKFFELGNRVGLNFSECGKIRTGNFSTGMRQRLKFAILLSVDAEIWLLDEPTANLDEEGRQFFLREICAGAESGKIILLATNDKADLEICGEVIELGVKNK